MYRRCASESQSPPTALAISRRRVALTPDAHLPAPCPACLLSTLRRHAHPDPPIPSTPSGTGLAQFCPLSAADEHSAGPDQPPHGPPSARYRLCRRDAPRPKYGGSGLQENRRSAVERSRDGLRCAITAFNFPTRSPRRPHLKLFLAVELDARRPTRSPWPAPASKTSSSQAPSAARRTAPHAFALCSVAHPQSRADPQSAPDSMKDVVFTTLRGTTTRPSPARLSQLTGPSTSFSPVFPSFRPHHPPPLRSGAHPPHGASGLPAVVLSQRRPRLDGRTARGARVAPRTRCGKRGRLVKGIPRVKAPLEKAQFRRLHPRAALRTDSSRDAGQARLLHPELSGRAIHSLSPHIPACAREASIVFA